MSKNKIYSVSEKIRPMCHIDTTKQNEKHTHINLRGLFEHERLKPAIIRTSQGNICNLAQLKQIINIGMQL